MKINLLILALLLGFLYSYSNSDYKMEAHEEMAMNQIINDIYKSDFTNQYTCDSVVLYSKGKITEKVCQDKLNQTNEHCASLAKTSVVALSTQEHAKDLVQILVTCPVAKMLGYPYEIINGKAVMQTPN